MPCGFHQVSLVEAARQSAVGTFPPCESLSTWVSRLGGWGGGMQNSSLWCQSRISHGILSNAPGLSHCRLSPPGTHTHTETHTKGSSRKSSAVPPVGQGKQKHWNRLPGTQGLSCLAGSCPEDDLTPEDQKGLCCSELLEALKYPNFAHHHLYNHRIQVQRGVDPRVQSV